jgi:cytochrome bd-type quinol oxidase subunit 2
MFPRRILLLVIGAIAASFAGTALFQPWTRPFTTALAVAAAVMFLLILSSRLDFRLPEKPKIPDRPRRNAARLSFAVCAILLAVLVWLVPWRPRADFDVVGFLWLMQNIVPAIGVCILFVAAIVSLGVWLRG